MKIHGKNAKTAMIPKTIILSLIFCVVFANGAPPAKSDYKFRVSVEVASDSHESIIKSYLSRGLRQIGDVEVVYDEALYSVRVVHVHHTFVNAYSIVVMESRHDTVLALTDRLHDEDLRELARELFDDVVSIKTHLLFMFGGQRDISEACEKIVAELDADVLEPHRQVLQKLRWRHKEQK